MTPQRHAGRKAVLVAVMVAATPGCQHVSLRDTNELTLSKPADGSHVRLPLRLSWHTQKPGARVAVLIDQSSLGPGDALLSLVPKTDPCRQRPSCPDAAWLSNNRIYVTNGTQITVESLPDHRRSDNDVDRHEVMIVLLDEDGTRDGEAFVVREFLVDREGA